MIDALSSQYERDLQLLDDQEEEFDFEYERQQTIKRRNKRNKPNKTRNGIGSIRTAPASTYTEEFYSNFNKLNDQYLEYYKGAYEEQKAIAQCAQRDVCQNKLLRLTSHPTIVMNVRNL